jgi:hypothetical protein
LDERFFVEPCCRTVQLDKPGKFTGKVRVRGGVAQYRGSHEGHKLRRARREIIFSKAERVWLRILREGTDVRLFQ